MSLRTINQKKCNKRWKHEKREISSLLLNKAIDNNDDAIVDDGDGNNAVQCDDTQLVKNTFFSFS